MGHDAGLTWDVILRSKRVLLVTEAGVGKTHECQQQAKRLWEAGEPAFYLDLAGLKDNALTELLSPEEEERFERWRASQSNVATFFLDSIDELELTLGKFDAALVRFSKSVVGHLQRIRVIITSRPIPIDEEVFRRRLPIPPAAEARPTSKDFADRAMSHIRPEKEKTEASPEWRNVALLPLTDDQILAMAALQHISDVNAFMTDIRRRDAEEFARRPQDLIELCADFRERHEIRTRADQIAANVTVKLMARTERPEKTELSEAKALAGAKRLALASLLHRSLTMRHSAAVDDQAGPESALDPSQILADWNAKERSTLLERPLFGFATYGRVRFHHRSVIEYLAAEELFDRLERGMPRASARRLLFAETAQGETVVRPSMRAVAAWLARRRNDIFEKVRDADPSVLLDFGDPASLSARQRISALGAYVSRYGKGGWRGLSVPYLQVFRFASPELGPELERLWTNGVESPEVRQLLLRLIAAGKCPEGADIAFSVATNSHHDGGERILALDALVGLHDSRLPMICDAVESDRTVWPNKLARGAVDSLFPEIMSAEQLCRALSTITESKSGVGELTYYLPQTVASAPLAAEQLKILRAGLSALINSGIYWHEQYYEPATRRRDLLPLLTVVCERLCRLTTVPSRELIASIVRILRVAPRDDPALKKHEKGLREILQQAPATVRATVFWEDEQFCASIYPISNRWQRLHHIAFRGPLSLTIDRDWTWICDAIGAGERSTDQCALALDIAITLAQRAESSMLHERLLDLRTLVSGDESLIEAIDAVERGPDPRFVEFEAEEERRLQVRQNEIDAAHQAWVKFWEELANNPAQLFEEERAENTVWSLWRAMSRNGEESRLSGWNRQFIEDHFSKEVADRMRQALMRLWRADIPTLRSERADDQKNTFLVKWQLGLAGIAAEAEDPNWANNITPTDAQTAARYAPIELNGFPFWLDQLVVAHPGTVDHVLGGELSAELNEPLAGPMRLIALQNISHASPATVRLFIPRLTLWLRGKARIWMINPNHSGDAQLLSDVLDLLIRYGDESLRRKILDMAVAELAIGLNPGLVTVWVQTLLQLDPESVKRHANGTPDRRAKRTPRLGF